MRYAICTLAEIPEGSCKGFFIENQSYFVIHKYGKIYGYKNKCPHLGIQLEMIPDQFLDSSHSLITCSMHGALFRIEDGLCISGPCLEQALEPITLTQETDTLFMLAD